LIELSIECLNKNFVLIETKPFQQARERTYLHRFSREYPCRMHMKEAGWFIFKPDDNQIVATCIYCRIFCKDWTHQYDPYKVHQVLSPACPFVLYR